MRDSVDTRFPIYAIHKHEAQLEAELASLGLTHEDVFAFILERVLRERFRQPREDEVARRHDDDEAAAAQAAAALLPPARRETSAKRAEAVGRSPIAPSKAKESCRSAALSPRAPQGSHQTQRRCVRAALPRRWSLAFRLFGRATVQLLASRDLQHTL